jgi:hypothetical protein
MNTAVAAVPSPAAVDPRMAAFLAPDCPEIFHSVATPSAIWQADPYDVETIHLEARAAFEHLLNRGGHMPPPPSGGVLALLGEAGSGKTHLMRAFRTRAHSQALGYCAYLQMTTEATSYARYMLTNLIDGLEQPYAPDNYTRTGLARLSTGLFEYVPGLSAADREALREPEGDATRLVDRFADQLHATERFGYCDLELLRIMLHLERKEPQVRSRALMWLRCQDMRPQDRAWIGGAVPRTDDADPMKMLQQLAELTDAVHGVPLVLLIDQLEDMANQSAPVERLLKVIDAVTAFTDANRNAVVVLACLEDYFNENIKRLTRSKYDRLTRDPEPVRLLGNRTLDEVREMAVRRLAYLYDEAGVEVDPAKDLYPFREEHLAPLSGRRSRDVLDALRRHHQRCIATGRWEEMEAAPVDRPHTPLVGPLESNLDAMWNDFHTAFQATVPDEEEELARVLAGAIGVLSAELPDGVHFGRTEPDGRYLEVEMHGAAESVGQLLVAVCNRKAQGGGLGKQLDELERRAGEIPVAIVRTTDFPKSGKACEQVARMLKRDGRRVPVADADWRRMLAFAAFCREHTNRFDFAAWQKAARPLSELDSLQRILKLNSLAPRARSSTSQPAMPAPRPSRSDSAPTTRPEPVVSAGASTAPVVLGRTSGVVPTPVTFQPNDFTYHAAFLGGTGSGKTTAALNLIEQLLARDIPAVMLDRKGDLCRYADPAAWGRPLPDEALTARRQALRDRLDVELFTPGEPNGRPLVLPVVPPAFDQLPEADRERFAQYAAAALGSMIGFKTSDRDQGQRAILAKAIETLAVVPGATITVSALRAIIEDQDDALLNAIGGGYPETFFRTLAQRLLTLELNNRQLLTGNEQLDIDALLGTGAHARLGRVRLSVISTRFLGDAAKVDFWVSQLLVAISRWCARSPRSQLQAVFLFDEADMYLPATRQPATKAPMEDLLKRARSAGVGVFLATQSPGDFDYKCKENVRTWLLGRVKEPRALEKLRPMLAAAKGNVTDKLAAQGTGEFYLVRDSSVMAVRSNESLIRTEQVPESQIAALAGAAARSR